MSRQEHNKADMTFLNVKLPILTKSLNYYVIVDQQWMPS